MFIRNCFFNKQFTDKIINGLHLSERFRELIKNYMKCHLLFQMELSTE
jgi:hypothetical protein